MMKLTNKDIHNLYDLFLMIDDETYDTLKLNGMEEWFKGIYNKIEKKAIPELHGGKER